MDIRPNGDNLSRTTFNGSFYMQFQLYMHVHGLEQLASACLIPPYGCLHHINKQAPFSFPNKGYKGYKGLAYSPRIWLIGFPNYIYV
eukprot:scaffold190100_cov16-Tisochrysis_lutea.AAC.1